MGAAEGDDTACDGRRTKNVRLLFLASLVLEVLAAGVCTYLVLNYYEVQSFRSRFRVLGERALDSTKSSFEKTRQTTAAVSAAVAGAFPNSTEWPQVVLPGFSPMTTQLAGITRADFVFFLPIVQPEEVTDFETFAYDYFDANPEYPALSGYHSFGKGIYKFGAALSQVPDAGGPTYWGARYDFLAPVITVTDPLVPAENFVLMYNAHSDHITGVILEYIVDCSAVRSSEFDTDNSVTPRSCDSTTDFVGVVLTFFGSEEPSEADVQTIVYSPVYTKGSGSEEVLSGFVGSTLTWSILLDDIIGSSESEDLLVVISTLNSVYSYTLSSGAPRFEGEGDKHNTDLDDYVLSADIITAVTDIDSATAGRPPYRIDVYPTRAFYDSYVTDTPWFGSAVVVAIVLFTAGVFLLYDYFVKQEVGAKDDLLELKRQFIRFICHEVRSPLNAMSLGLEILLEKLTKDANQNTIGKETERNDSDASNVEMCTEILQNSNLAASVLDDLISFDELQNKALRMQFGEIDICAILAKLHATFGVSAKLQNLKFELEFNVVDSVAGALDDEVSLDMMKHMRVIGDKSRLEHVLRVLLFHAFKFTQDGGTVTLGATWHKSPDATFSSIFESDVFTDFTIDIPMNSRSLFDQPRVGSIQVWVKDNGMGMPSDVITPIFERDRKFCIDDLQSSVGEGLGIFLCRKIMRMHFGGIWVESKGSGCGCTFFLKLPLFRCSDDLPGSHHPQETALSILESKPSLTEDETIPSKHILVCDDVPSCRKILIRMLFQRGGHICDEAVNGQDALEKYAKSVVDGGPGYDTILMDSEMPVLNGPNATLQLRRRGCSCLIVGVTGNVLPADVTVFTDHGVNAVLPKPFNYAELEYLWRNQDGCFALNKSYSLITSGQSFNGGPNDSTEPKHKSKATKGDASAEVGYSTLDSHEKQLEPQESGVTLV